MSPVPLEAPTRSASLFCINLFFGLFSHYFTQMVFFLKRYQYYQIGTSSPSGWLRHHRLLSSSPIPLLLSEASLPPLRVTLTHFILLSGSLSPNLLSHFRFGQTWSETKTLQIVLESLCVHSLAHASFYHSLGGSSSLPSLSFLESAFLHCGFHPFLLMLSL